jgi:hypothetical protein
MMMMMMMMMITLNRGWLRSAIFCPRLSIIKLQDENNSSNSESHDRVMENMEYERFSAIA